MELSHDIDWNKLEYRFAAPNRASAHWRGIAVAKATVDDGDRERLVALLSQEIHDAIWADARRPAGTLGNPENGLADFAESLGVPYVRRG
jgi:hypothetical protein